MKNISDPQSNFAYDMHQYFDQDSSGQSDTCLGTWNTSSVMDGATEWLRSSGRKAFIGEFGSAPNTACIDILNDFLTYLETNSDVWIGWTYWAAGPWWGTYSYSVEPKSKVNSHDQWNNALKNHLGL